MLRVTRFVLGLLVAPMALAAEIEPALKADLGLSVFKVEAHAGTGTLSLGSAVMIAPGVLVTNCHVTRGAHHIHIIGRSGNWLAEPRASDAEHDLCLLSAPRVEGRVAALGGSRDLSIGEDIYAAGYPAGSPLTWGTGRVEELYSLDNARVIQGSAPFTFGASGGGLFDESGRLIGILTFKARAGGRFHFAMPVEWVQALASGGIAPGEASTANDDAMVAFWQRPAPTRPYFLRAVSLEASEDWVALSALAGEWLHSDATNPEAWSFVRRAVQHLQVEADYDLEKVGLGSLAPFLN